VVNEIASGDPETKEIQMNGKTHTIRRRLSIIALTASFAALAIPAANAGGKHPAIRVLGPGLNTVEKQGPYGAYWIRKRETIRVLGPGLNTVEKRGPYGAYWVSKSAQDVGSQGIVRYPRADDPMFREIVQEAAQEHGSVGFGNYLDLSWKPRTVDSSLLREADRPTGITP
jgi:hypothetical protein